jgi:hypothetical protein
VFDKSNTRLELSGIVKTKKIIAPPIFGFWEKLKEQVSKHNFGREDRANLTLEKQLNGPVIPINPIATSDNPSNNSVLSFNT